MRDVRPRLTVHHAARPVQAVVLVLHGGAQWGGAQVRPWALAYVRMRLIAHAIHRTVAREGIEVRVARNRLRGWNEPELDAVRDARWALRRVRAERPRTPVALVGHSMGGRAALRVADDEAVAGVCALAPWTPNSESVQSLRNRTVVVAHGTHDRTTRPEGSHAYAVRADADGVQVARFEVGRDGHAMLRRPAVWHRLIRAFVRETCGAPPVDGVLASAWSTPTGKRLRIPV